MADRDELDWIKENEPWRLPEYQKDEKDEPGSSDSVLDTSETEDKWDYMKLTKIKGIGEERAKDIGRMFNSEEELIQALKNDNVGLRNDVVILLKSYFNINKTGGI